LYPLLNLFDILIINSYGFFIGIGGILSYYFLLIHSKSIGLKQKFLPVIFLLALVSAYIGGRVMFFFENITFYVNNPLEIFDLSNKGFAIYGGIIFSGITLLIFFKKIGRTCRRC
jgi:phosphatidylglycerol:prolipoprotein diacylglycerol transferase